MPTPIVRAITVPRFAARDFDITKFGAVGDGAKLCTEAIAKAIAACRAAGGGTVVVPDGRFVTGAVRLESGVNLHLSDKATLAFSHDPRITAVVFTRWEGVELMNYSPFIYACDVPEHRVTGNGHARRPGGRGALVELARRRAVRDGAADGGAHPADRDAGARAFRLPNASSAMGTTCARISSSPTAAATSSSRACGS